MLYFFSRNLLNVSLAITMVIDKRAQKTRWVQVHDEVIEIPLLESLEQWLNNPSILKQASIKLH